MDRLARTVKLENVLLDVANGKRPLPTRDECRRWAQYLGTPNPYTPDFPTKLEAILAKGLEAIDKAVREACAYSWEPVEPPWLQDHRQDMVEGALKRRARKQADRLLGTPADWGRL